MKVVDVPEMNYFAKDDHGEVNWLKKCNNSVDTLYTYLSPTNPNPYLVILILTL